MTINTTVRAAGPFVGTGALVNYPFTFRVFQASDVVVRYTAPPAASRGEVTAGDGSESLDAVTWVPTTDYTVTLNADQDANPGGFVTPSQALPAASVLRLTSGIPETQPTALTNLGGFFPKVIERALDRVTILIQQLRERVDGLVVSAGGLPAQAGKAGQYLSTDGTEANWAPVSAGGSGSAMPTVRDAPFNAAGNGTTADQAAFAAASAAFAQVRVPPGTYRIAASVTVTAGLSVDAGALFAVDAGVTLTLSGPFVSARVPRFTGLGTVVFVPGSVDHVCAEWFGLSATGTEVNNTAALQKAWVAAYGTALTVGRGAFPLGDTELKVFALAGASQLPSYFRGVGVDGNGGGGGVSVNVGTSFFGNAARLNFNNDTANNSDAKIIVSGFHIVGPNDNFAGVGGIRVNKVSNIVIEDTQVTGSRGHGYEMFLCYGAVVRNNTALSCRWHGLLWNRQGNQAVSRDNKLIGNGKDYTGIYANLAFAGGATFESLGHFCDNNDTSYAGNNAVLYRKTNPTPTANSITITNIVVSGSTATATTATAHGRATGDFISVFGISADVRLNTIFTPSITVTSSTTFTWPVILQPNQVAIAAAGTYTDANMVIGPAAYGAIYNDMRGARISHYAEDCIGLAAYIGSNNWACEFGGGYDQGFATTLGGNGAILIDNATGVHVSALSLSGGNSSLQINATARKHGINVGTTVTVEGGAFVSYPSIQLRDGQYYASAAPTTGTWSRGEWVQNLLAAPGAPQGWYCSAAPSTFVAIDGAAAGGSLPTQTGQSGKFLSTDGTTASWQTAGGSGLPTLVSGNILTNNGTTASWYLPTSLSSLSANLGAITSGTISTSGAISTTGNLAGAAGNFSGLVTAANFTTGGGLSANTASFTGGVTVTGTLTGGAANFSAAVSAGGFSTGGSITAGSGNITSGGLTVAGGFVVSGGGASFTGAVSFSATTGNAVTVTAPTAGAATGLRVVTSGGGTTGVTIDGGSGGTALNLIGSVRMDLAVVSGGAAAQTTFLAAKPGTAKDGTWLKFNANGVSGQIPFWPD